MDKLDDSKAMVEIARADRFYKHYGINGSLKPSELIEVLNKGLSEEGLTDLEVHDLLPYVAGHILSKLQYHDAAAYKNLLVMLLGEASVIRDIEEERTLSVNLKSGNSSGPLEELTSCLSSGWRVVSQEFSEEIGLRVVLRNEQYESEVSVG